MKRPPAVMRFQLLAPLHAQAGEYGFEVGIPPVELVLPLVDGGHVVEELAREQAVFGGGDEQFHPGGVPEQDGEVAALHFRGIRGRCGGL